MPHGYFAQTNLERCALAIATKAHNGQMRKCVDATPYITHPINVGLLLQQSGESSSTIAGGLLHDVLEKAYLRYDRPQMRRDFGHDITNTVGLVTKNPYIKNWYKRNILYLKTMSDTQNVGALAICAADKSSNLADTIRDYEVLGEAMWDRFNSKKADQLWWYESTLKVVTERIPKHPLVQRLGKQVVQLQEIVNLSTAA